MASNVKLALLQGESARHGQDIERLYAKHRRLEDLPARVERLEAWRAKINARIHIAVRWGLWGGALTALHFASEPWASVLRALVAR